MKCQNCGEHDANFKYTEIINGVKKELNLCEDCARKMGVADINFNIPINFSSFFGDFLNEYDNSPFMPMIATPSKLQCDECKMTYDEFMNTGRFGCSHCYDVFADRIEPVLKRLHGNTKYLGRNAKVNTEHIKEKEDVKSENHEIENLRKELKKAIKDENYERAAELRDKIKELEGGNN